MCQSIRVASRPSNEKYCDLEKRFCVDSPSHTANCSVLHFCDHLHIHVFIFKAVTTACQTITRNFDYNEVPFNFVLSPHHLSVDARFINFVYSPRKSFGDVSCIWVRHSYCHLAFVLEGRELVLVDSACPSKLCHNEHVELAYFICYPFTESLLPMVVVSVKRLSSVANLAFAGYFAMATQFCFVILEDVEMTWFCNISDVSSSLEHVQIHFYLEHCSNKFTKSRFGTTIKINKCTAIKINKRTTI